MARFSMVVCFLLFATSAIAQSAGDFFNDEVLHEIRLDVRPSDWQSLKDHFLENTNYAADMHWRFDGRDVTVAQVSIRSRGTGSRSGIKPGLRVDFDFYNSTQTFLGLKSFILRNNTQDASMLHERLSFLLMRRMGLQAPRAAHTRLYVNDQYVGLYMIVENVDKAFLKSRFGDNTGYLYDYDWAEPYSFEYRGADPALYSPTPFKPQTHEKDPAPAPIVAMIQTINQASDADFQNSAAQYLDLRAFISEIAIEGYLAESDGLIGDFGLNNFFLYRPANSNGFQIIPWDKSQSFEALDRNVLQNANTNVLSRRSLGIPDLLNVFIETLSKTATFAGGPSGWLEQEIAREYVQIRDAAREDPYKQCDVGKVGQLLPCSNDDFENEISYLTQFARERNDRIAQQLASVLAPAPAFGQQSFVIPDRGGASFSTAGNSASATVGYAQIQTDAGMSPPAGVAIFSFRQNNVLVTEAAVPASTPVLNGRIYAEVNGPVQTGLAIANPNPQPATVTFYFTDSSGHDFGRDNVTVPPNGQLAKFLNEPPFNGGTIIDGSFTFSSTIPVGVVALRGFTNEQSEFLITTLPVADLSNSASPPSILPHFADGNGWSTQVILVNPSDDTIGGTVQFWGKGSSTTPAQLVNVTVDGREGNSFTYSIAPRSSVRLTSSGAGTAIQTGSIRLASNNRLPIALAVFSYKVNGITVTQSGVPAMPAAAAFRLYVESAGPIQSGIAIANTSTSSVVMTYELTSLSGERTGLTGTTEIPGNGQTSMFLNEMPGLQPLPDGFRGILRVSASVPVISVLGLRGHTNERNHFLIATTPAVVEDATPGSPNVLFPHLVDSGGYTTQFILYSAYTGQNPAGALQYFSQNGQVLDLRMQQ